MKILNTVFAMSITGSIMFFIFLLLKPATKRYFDSSWHYKMLILTLTFFIIPANSFIKLPIKPIQNILKSEAEQSAILQNTGMNIREVKGEMKDIGNSISTVKEMPEYALKNEYKVKNNAPNQISAENQKTQSIGFYISNYISNYINNYISNYIGIIQYIWIVGVIILLIINLVTYIKFKYSVLCNSTIVEDKDIVMLFNVCKEELNIKTNVQLRTCNAAASPMLIGIMRPVVLVSNIYNIDSDYKGLKMIFIHELNHYKRKDIIIKFFGLIITAVHWFNPFVYVLSKEIDKYCEYFTDEKVVEEMDINDRKCYAETILSFAGSQMFKKISLTTAMGSSGKQLKARLENMIYSFKITRRKRIMSLFAAVLILISSFTAACGVLPGNISGNNLKKNDPFVVYIKEDGLYYSYLNGKDEIKIHDGNGFEYPLVSKEGSYIAYTNKGSLFVYSVKDKKYEKIDDGIEHYYRSYDWIDDTSIIYGSNEKSGFTVLNMITKKRTEHLDEYCYTGLMSSGNNMVYGRREYRQAEAEGDFITGDGINDGISSEISNSTSDGISNVINNGINNSTSSGIVEININNYDEKKKLFSVDIIIEDTKSTDEAIGYNPVVWNISKDGRYIYIMEKPASASLSSDGVGLGIYDLIENTYTEFTDIHALPYKNHLAVITNNNTVDVKNTIALIQGSGRDMSKNKKVILLEVNDDKSYTVFNITEEGFVAMTPSFSSDGNKLLYSAAKDLEKQYYSIYEYDLKNYQDEHDLKSSSVRKITEGNNSDFMPVSISNDEILFIRYNGNDYYSLIKLDNGKETVIADNIVFKGGKGNNQFSFYGHIHTEMGMDIFVSKNNENN